jgi:hypothetical protein
MFVAKILHSIEKVSLFHFIISFYDAKSFNFNDENYRLIGAVTVTQGGVLGGKSFVNL